jgi:glycosyltransferase involved in cell wall biosynthesis
MSLPDSGTAALIPAYQEALAIGGVVAETRKYVTTVLVVDDGSTDATADIAAAEGALVLQHDRRLGVGAALRSGFEFLRANGHRTVVSLDGDGAHNPSQIPSLLSRHTTTSADLTVGSRFCDSSLAAAVPSAKRAANFVATSLFNVVFASAFSDVASGMRVWGKRALEAEYTVNDFGFVYETLVVARENDWNVHESPISVVYNAANRCCTSRVEALQVAGFLRSRSTSPALKPVLSELERCLKKSYGFRLRFGGGSVLGTPLPSRDAYVFQMTDGPSGIAGEVTLERDDIGACADSHTASSRDE